MSQTTRTTIEARLAELSKTRPYELLLAYLSLALWPRNSATAATSSLALSCVVSLLEHDADINSSQNFDEAAVSALIDELVGFVSVNPAIDDYVPEIEWGRIALAFRGSLYRIFYGGPFDTAYDFFKEYELGSRVCQDSLVREVELVLAFQNDVIELAGFDDQINDEGSSGHVETPTGEFIQAMHRMLQALPDYAKEYGQQLCDSLTVTRESLPTLQAALGDYEEEFATFSKSLFVRLGDLRLPLLPSFSLGVIGSLGERVLTKLREDDNCHRAFELAIVEHLVACNCVHGAFSDVNLFKDGIESTVSALLVAGRVRIWMFFVDPSTVGDAEVHSGIRSTIELIQADGMDVVTAGETHGSVNEKLLGLDLLRRCDHEFIVVPFNFLTNFSLLVEADDPSQTILLPALLSIAGSVDDPNRFVRFLRFFKSEGSRIPFLNPADVFFFFRDFAESIESGAVQYDMVSVDPHWASNSRFKDIAPKIDRLRESDFVLDVDHWNVNAGSDGICRFLAKRGSESITCISVGGDAKTYLKADWTQLDGDRRVIGFTVEIVEGALKWIAQCFGSERIAGQWFSIVQSRDADQAISVVHANGAYEISVVGAELLAQFRDCKDRAEEWAMVELLADAVGYDRQTRDHVATLQKAEIEKIPRYLASVISLPAAIPSDVYPVDVEDRHFKEARRTLAQAAARTNIQPGTFAAIDAKAVINQFLKTFHDELRGEITKYEGPVLLQILMQELGAMSFRCWFEETRVHQSKAHAVEYDRAAVLSELRERFLRESKNLRLLVEMANAERVSKGVKPTPDAIAYMSAMADWFQVIQIANDQIHYGLQDVTLTLDNEFVPKVAYPEGYNAAEARLNEFLAIDTQAASVDIPLEGIENGVERIADAFYIRYGFRITDAISALEYLANWGSFKERSPQRIYLEEIPAVVKEVASALDVAVREAHAALLWLCLDPAEMYHVTGQKQPTDMLPIWESLKRPQRYPIRPLMRVGAALMWEPMSCYDSANVWKRSVTTARQPIAFEADEITSAFSDLKFQLERNLESAAANLLREFTEHVELNLDLGKRFKRAGFPKDLGDYDVLAHLPQSDCVFAVEAKHLLLPYCAKDAKRFFDKLYGYKGNEKKGYMYRAERRGRFLQENMSKIASALGWDGVSNTTTVVNTFLVDRVMLWHFYPPRPYAVDIHTLRTLRLDLTKVAMPSAES